MHLKFHGAAQEVGRSCISLDDSYLLDSGIKITPQGNEYPQIDIDLRTIKAVFLTHAHLDHSGALPLFNSKGLNCPIYCTHMTKLLAKLLLEDSLKIEYLTEKIAGYEKNNIRNVLINMEINKYDKWSYFKGGKYMLLYSGHIPGSSSILIEYKGKKILYTGDISLTETYLLKPLTYHKSIKNIDVVIIESTYGGENHPTRKQTEKEFLDCVQEILDKGGKVIVPCFAVGRSQEILLLLHQRNFQVPIYIDGMAKKVCNILLKKPDFINNPNQFKSVLNKIKFVAEKSRKRILRDQGIFVTTSGMLDGGPVLEYIKHCYADETCGILLTGYQSDESNGRLLLDSDKIDIDGERYKFNGIVKHFDFSGHAGHDELIEFIESISPKNVILQHGDVESLEELKKSLSKLTANVYVPKVGDTVKIE